MSVLTPILTKVKALGLVTTVALLATVVGPPPAHGVAGYSVGGGPWNLRGCSSTICSSYGQAPNGPLADMICQAWGETVTIGAGSTQVWDKVRTADGTVGFITDMAVNETPLGQFDSRIPRCTGTPAKAVYYQPRYSTTDPVPDAALVVPLDNWSQWESGACLPDSADNFPEVTTGRKVTTLAGWSLGRLGVTYLLVWNFPRAAAVNRIVLYDPGSYDEYFGEGSCDLQYDQSEAYRRWLALSPNNRLLILAGKVTKDIDTAVGPYAHRGIQEALFPKIRNTPLAQQVLVCNYNDLDHQAVLDRFRSVAANGPWTTCPAASGVRLYASWHP